MIDYKGGGATTRQRSWLDTSGHQKYHAESELPTRLRLARWLGRQTWLPRGHGRLLRLLLVNPETCPHFHFEVDFFGQKYRGDLAQYIDWYVFCYGLYAPSELYVLRKCVAAIRSLRSGPVLFADIGANVGHHTLFMSPIVDQVIAFEPFPPLQSLIEQKIALNNLANVTLMPFALGEKDELMDYYPGEGANSGAGTFLPDGDERRAPAKLYIKHGDRLFDQQAFGTIAIMKVDVEGFEPFVFHGLRNRIQRDRPAILTELSDQSRRHFGSEQAFRDCFYADAEFAEVPYPGRPKHWPREMRADIGTGHGRGSSFTLRRFSYATSREVLIVPSELHWFQGEA